MTSGSGKSDMNGWTDGVAYTNLEVINNSFYENGVPSSYNGWSRTGYVPCDGAGSIEFPRLNVGNSTSYLPYNFFFDASKAKISSFTLNASTSTIIAVPQNAKYWGVSCTTTAINEFVADDIIPYK